MSKEIKTLPDNKRKSSKQLKPVRTHQPTYRLNPKKSFSVEVVERILRSLLVAELEEFEYSDKVAPELCLSLSESIRNAVKEENFDRYRVIVSVTVGQRRQQSVQMFHAFLWDHERDAFATYSFENAHMYANAVVYGIYLD